MRMPCVVLDSSGLLLRWQRWITDLKSGLRSLRRSAFVRLAAMTLAPMSFRPLTRPTTTTRTTTCGG
jgi:hypothetical protein